MSDLRKQLRDHYDAQSLPPEKVEAVLERGRAVAGQGADAGVAEEKVVRFPRRWLLGLAVAASVAVFAGLGLWRQAQFARVSYAALAPEVVGFLGKPHELSKRSQHPEELRAWLIAQGAPANYQIPAQLRALQSFGCKVLDVHGRPAYLTCFLTEKKPGIAGPQSVHLLVAHRRDFSDAPPVGGRQFHELDGWSFASWTEGDVIYTLAAPAPVDALRSFLATRGSSAALLAVR